MSDEYFKGAYRIKINNDNKKRNSYIQKKNK